MWMFVPLGEDLSHVEGSRLRHLHHRHLRWDVLQHGNRLGRLLLHNFHILSSPGTPDLLIP